MELLIVTGLSGAGKSCVMNALEDAGYFCMDNLPSKLIPVFAKLLKEAGEHERVAVVTDIRAGLTDTELKTALLLLDELSVPFSVLFLDCSEEVLLSRYKQSRRIHPLMNGKCDTLTAAISAEKALLSSVKEMSDLVLDTSELSFFDCKAKIISMFCENAQKQMLVHCMSFGFKYGVPKDADYVFDVRFLPNPFYVPSLKELTGLDEAVQSFVMDSPFSGEFEEKLHSLVSFTVSRCINEGRGQLVIAIGCTGGHHRSVTIAERLSAMLKDNDYKVTVTHRDIKK